MVTFLFDTQAFSEVWKSDIEWMLCVHIEKHVQVKKGDVASKCNLAFVLL